MRSHSSEAGKSVAERDPRTAQASTSVFMSKQCPVPLSIAPLPG